MDKMVKKLETGQQLGKEKQYKVQAVNTKMEINKANGQTLFQIIGGQINFINLFSEARAVEIGEYNANKRNGNWRYKFGET